MLISNDPQQQFDATQNFRKLLTSEQNPPIQEIIASGVVPRFVQFLKDVSRPELQFETAWVLTNVASGTADQTRTVVEHGALPIFVDLLHSPSDNVRELSVWALGNIVGDSPNFRDLVLQSGGLSLILAVLREADNTSLLRNTTWTLSNLCRGKPPPDFSWVSPALPTLANLLHTNDTEVMIDACWAFCYLSDGPSERAAALVSAAGVCRRLVELLQHPSHLVQTPALRAVGNVSTGGELQTQVIIECGALPLFHKMLSHTRKNIRRDCCWTISNITAGTKKQIQEVINNNLIPPVIFLLQGADFDTKKEAAWAISNVACLGSPAQIGYLVQCGCTKPLLDLLEVEDASVLGVALDAVDHILMSGRRKQCEENLAENPMVKFVEEAGGLRKIELLKSDSCSTYI